MEIKDFTACIKIYNQTDIWRN